MSCTECDTATAEPELLDPDAMLTAVAMLLHELRNAHNGIQWLIRTLSKELPPTAATVRHATLLTTLCEQQVAILNDMLLLARTRTDPLQLHTSAAHIPTLVEQVSLLHTDAAMAKGLTLSRAIEPGVPTECRIDVQRVQQVLGNLLSNAIQYTSRGHVALAVRAASDPGDQHVAVCFEVSDTGSGLNEGSLSKLGRPFERLDSDAIEPNGSGLGIAVARRLVQAMGGTLSFTSRPGEGTRATVKIPVEPN